ncbi:MAG: hypothetical protein ACK496_07570 [Acidobacteriota bacterium]
MKRYLIVLILLIFILFEAFQGGSRIAHAERFEAEMVGKDGTKMVEAPGEVVNLYATLAADAPAGTGRLVLTYPTGPHGLRPESLSAGDLLLVIQMSGATIDLSDSPSYGMVTSLNNAGRYEFITVGRVEAGQVTVKPPCGGLLHSYEAREKVQVIRVPQYSALRIATGASLTAPAWNGAYGGIVAVHVKEELVIDGRIDVSGLGLRGGALSAAGGGLYRSDYVTTQQDYGAEKGEGIVGYQTVYDHRGGRYARGAAANAGGGGTAHNAGGGGGANGDNGALWNGAGVMDGSATGATAWTLDPDFTANGGQLTSSSGGGRGGYSFSDTNRDALTLAPGENSWGGDKRRNVGGRGGRPVAQDPGGRLFMGGGGGAGAQNNNSGGGGGNAGGLIYLLAGSVSGGGELRANGNPGQDTQRENRDGAGGGGAGGTIVVYASEVREIRAVARGGKGGDQIGALFPNEAESQGPGGGGGGGYIAYRGSAGGSILTDVAGGANGVSRAPSMGEFPANGATLGAAGQVVTSIGSIPFCYTTSDLVVTKSNNQDYIIPGLPTTYTIEVSNAGANGIWGIEVVDRLPEGFIAETKAWSCVATPGSACSVATGTGDLLTSVDLLRGGRATFRVTAVMAAGATGTVTNQVEVIPPPGATDPNLANNIARDTDRLTPVADLAVRMESGGRELVPGLGVSYQISVRNQGPSDARSFAIRDLAPASILVESFSCVASGHGACGQQVRNGNQLELTNASLEAGAGNELTISITGTISTAASGRLINAVELVIGAGAGFTDPDLSNNLARDDAPLVPQANLIISKTNHLNSVIAGSNVDYEIEVTNLGPSDAVGFNITDEIPPMMNMSNVTCTSVGGDCGSQSVNGQMIEVAGASLPAGGGRAIRMRFGGPISSSAVGRVVSVATVQIPAGADLVDPEPASNTALDDDPVVAEADLSISKTISSGSVTAGGAITYRIEVANAGPSAVTGALVEDLPPAGLEGLSWSCQSPSGSSCQSTSGSGAIRALVDLGVNGRAIFTLTGQVSPETTGQLTNQARVAAPSGTTDPNLLNNTATAQANVGVNSDLQISKTASASSVKIGESLTYTLTARNNGPSIAREVVITDLLPVGLEVVSFSSTRGTCTSAAERIECSVGNLGTASADNAATVTIVVRIPRSFAIGTMVNTATIQSSTPDPQVGNNSSRVSVTVNPAPRPIISAINVSNNTASSCLGSYKLFTVSVRFQNSGDGDLRDNPGPELVAQLPVELAGVVGTCSASTGDCRLGSNQLEWNGQIAPGQSLTVSYQVRVRSGINNGARFCTRFRVNFDVDGDGFNDSSLTRDDCLVANCRETASCTGADCPGVGPGVAMINSADPVSSGTRPGSILIFPYFTSSSVDSARQNTRITVTNVDAGRSVFLHLFYVDGLTGSVADNFICLTANQTASFLMSDMDPDVSGYLIAVVVNENGCPIRMNSLIGETAVRTTAGFYATVPAEGVAALATPSCLATATETTLRLDGQQYSLLGRTLAVDSVLSPASGDRTMIVVNGIGGNLTGAAPQLGKVNGLIFDDVEQAYSFTSTEGVQMAQILTSTYPRSTPRFTTIVPAGRTGWIKLASQNTAIALTGLRMTSNNPPGSFGDGINLHKLTLGPTTLTIPVIMPSCQ